MASFARFRVIRKCLREFPQAPSTTPRRRPWVNLGLEPSTELSKTNQSARSALYGSFIRFAGSAETIADFFSPAIVTTRPGPARPPPGRRPAMPVLSSLSQNRRKKKRAVGPIGEGETAWAKRYDFGVGFCREVIKGTLPETPRPGQTRGKGPLPASRRKSHSYKAPEAVGISEKCRFPPAFFSSRVYKGDSTTDRNSTDPFRGRMARATRTKSRVHPRERLPSRMVS